MDVEGTNALQLRSLYEIDETTQVMTRLYLCFAEADFDQAATIANLLRQISDNLEIDGSNSRLSPDEIREKIAACDIVVYLITPRAISNNRWQNQVDEASRQKKPLQGLMLEQPDQVVPEMGQVAPIDMTEGQIANRIDDLMDILDRFDSQADDLRRRRLWYGLIVLGVALLLGIGGMLLLDGDNADDNSPSPTPSPETESVVISILSPGVDISANATSWQAIINETSVAPGFSIRTQSGAGAILTFADGDTATLSEESQVRIEHAAEGNATLDLIHGSMVMHLHEANVDDHTHIVQTSLGRAIAIGITNQILLDENQAVFRALIGDLQVEHEDDSTIIEAGNELIIRPDESVVISTIIPSPTPTSTATASMTASATATVTQTPTATSTASPSNTATATQTATATASASPTITGTLPPTATPTVTNTATVTASPTASPTITRTPSPTQTSTHTATPSNTPTSTPSWTAIPTNTALPTETTTPTIDPESVICPGAPAPRLRVGDQASVINDTGVNVRVEPNVEAELVANIPFGTEVEIIGGPVCQGPFLWWQLRLADERTGWSAEGDSETYYFDPG